MSYVINNKDYESIEEFVLQGRGCATITPNHYQVKRNDLRISSVRKAGSSRPTQIHIPIRFIHIYDSDFGLIGETQRVNQIDVLNAAYGQYGIMFSYSKQDVIQRESSRWYRMDHGSSEEREAKRALGYNSDQILNFYTAGPPGILGWATFPWDREGDPEKDGVVVLDGTLPGGNTQNFNLGKTAVHEVGHWLGLYHTFQGGCDAYGDHVGDTPAHTSPNHGKPDIGRHNACPTEQNNAPINNFMNYVDDEWMTEFTIGQIDRLKDHVSLYRQNFIVS